MRIFNTNKLTKWIFLFGLVSASTSVLTAEPLSKLELHGLGLHRALGQEIYIGSLFKPSDLDVQSLVSSRLPKKIRLDVLASKIPAHRVSRMFKESIAMNNTRNQWEAFGDQILAFTGQFREPLIQGDRIDIHYQPNQGTRIMVNDVLFFEEESHNFFVLLMMSWLGDLPPSNALKEGLLGLNTKQSRSQLERKLASLTMIEGRLQKPLENLPQPEKKLVETTKKVSKPSTVVQSRPRPSPTPIAEANKKNAQQLTQQSPKTLQLAKQQKPKSDLTLKPEHLAELTAPQVFEETQIQQTNLQATSPSALKKLSLSRVSRVDVDLERGSYTRELIGELRKHQKYPSRAWRLGLQGNALVSIKIDSEGRILQTALVESTGRKILDKAIKKMVLAAEPLPAIPQQLEQEEFEFTVPYSFQQ
ncbi:MAG: TonB family protein [Pseudomonadota bacterium]